MAGLREELWGIRDELLELVALLKEVRDILDVQVLEVARHRDIATKHFTGRVLPPMRWDPEEELYRRCVKKGKKVGEDEEETEDRGKGSSSGKTREQWDEGQ